MARLRTDLILKNFIKPGFASYFSITRSYSDFVEKKIDVNGSHINVVISGNVKNAKHAALLMPGALVSINERFVINFFR